LRFPPLLLLLLLASAACAHARRAGEPAAFSEGLASYYGDAFRGRPTASGEPFDPDALTAAHRTLPFGTCLRVESVASGRSVEVRINDRGPFVKDRIVDLSEAAARSLELVHQGVGRVRLFRCAG
jgi:rare lipoprotein A